MCGVPGWLLAILGWGTAMLVSCNCLLTWWGGFELQYAGSVRERLAPWLVWELDSNVPDQPGAAGPVAGTWPESPYLLATPCLVTRSGRRIRLAPLGSVVPLGGPDRNRISMVADLAGGAAAVLARDTGTAETGLGWFNAGRADQEIRRKGLDSLSLDSRRLRLAIAQGTVTARDFAARQPIGETPGFVGDPAAARWLANKDWRDARLLEHEARLFEGVNVLVAAEAGPEGFLEVLVLQVVYDPSGTCRACGVIEQCVVQKKRLPGSPPDSLVLADQPDIRTE